MDDHRDPASGVVARLGEVRARIAGAERAAGRRPGSVRLLLATKTVPIALVRAAVDAGVDLVGENRVQELVAKGPELAELPVEIHLIGHLQGNKVNPALRWASCVESIDSLEIAKRLGERSTDAGQVLDVLLQVNASSEPSKFGVPPALAADLAAQVGTLAGLRLRGFMTIGANSADAARVRAGYARLGELRDDVVASGEQGTAEARELSMGMSGDLELAIAAGATIVRVGTAVFGARSA